jgi:hypothetical protein
MIGRAAGIYEIQYKLLIAHDMGNAMKAIEKTDGGSQVT